MDPARSQFDSLLSRLSHGDVVAVRRISELRASMDPKSFRILVSEAVNQWQGSETLKFLELFEIRDLTQMLLESYLESKEKAIAAAAKLAAADPRFDAAFLECLREPSQEWSDDALLVGLDILDAVSERDRLVLNVLRLLKHENPKLRSKAALFIARRRPHLRWVSDLSRETDARVRANTLESLFGIKEQFIAPLFRQHVTDENNRVAGNAVLGLYLLGDTASIQMLEHMAKDERPSFRNTGVWVMGQTGDPRFASILASHLGDSDKFVRRQALRGLGKIKEALKLAREQNRLRATILRHAVDNGRESLAAAVTTLSGEPVRGIPGTKFIPKSAGVFIREYAVEECDSQSPVNIAFIKCPGQSEDSLTPQFELATTRCFELRRPKDKVQTSQLSYDAQLRWTESSPEPPPSFREAVSDIDFNSPNLQIILVSAAQEANVATKLLEHALTSEATVHVIAASSAWAAPELVQRVHNRGGNLILSDPSDVEQAALDMHLALLHHYRLEWHSTEGELDLEVRGETATGSVTLLKQRFPDNLPEPGPILDSDVAA